jgi:hypothetical protein
VSPFSLPKTRGEWLLWCSHVLIAIGVGFAVLAFLSAPDPPNCEDPDSPCSVFGVGERRAQNFQLERIGGKAMVMAVEFQAWVASWFHGRKLTALVSIVAFLAAWLFWKIAAVILEEEAEAARLAAMANDGTASPHSTRPRVDAP